MQATTPRALLCLLTLWLAPTQIVAAQAGREIPLRVAPKANAAIIAQIIASHNVVVDAPPAGGEIESSWRQLVLPSPFQGYVPIDSLNKNMELSADTPVHYLPDLESAIITRVEQDDRYEILRTEKYWAVGRFKKSITGYFSLEEPEDFARLESNPTPEPARRTAHPIKFRPAPATLGFEPALEPLAFPAPARPINPDQAISQTPPESLPPENVAWRPAPDPGPTATSPASQAPAEPGTRASGIMVPSDQTQAREELPELCPDQTPRLLTGRLGRQILTEGPSYPIRLRSDEGRLIAYVDLSTIFLEDISPFLDERVFLRGQVHPLPGSSHQHVILVEEIRISE